jgi:P-type conjugative transfer protein TrbJ
MTKRLWIRAGAFALVAALVPQGPAAAMPVFDATNYAQNLLQASRALEQINHQIRSLQNEAAMIEAMTRNLKTLDFPQLARIDSALRQIDALMGKAKGIGFKTGELEARFRAMFPDAERSAAPGERVAAARARLDGAMDAFRHSMAVQARVVANVEEDAGLLNEIARTSEGAVGALQAEQAASQLIALGAKQQMQIEELLASHFRSEALERAAREQDRVEARAATRRFLGSGKAGAAHR